MPFRAGSRANALSSAPLRRSLPPAPRGKLARCSRVSLVRSSRLTSARRVKFPLSLQRDSNARATPRSYFAQKCTARLRDIIIFRKRAFSRRPFGRLARSVYADRSLFAVRSFSVNVNDRLRVRILQTSRKVEGCRSRLISYASAVLQHAAFTSSI